MMGHVLMEHIDFSIIFEFTIPFEKLCFYSNLYDLTIAHLLFIFYEFILIIFLCEIKEIGLLLYVIIFHFCFEMDCYTYNDLVMSLDRIFFGIVILCFNHFSCKFI
jgi:hypothetical protein